MPGPRTGTDSRTDGSRGNRDGWKASNEKVGERPRDSIECREVIQRKERITWVRKRQRTSVLAPSGLDFTRQLLNRDPSFKYS